MCVRLQLPEILLMFWLDSLVKLSWWSISIQIFSLIAGEYRMLECSCSPAIIIVLIINLLCFIDIVA